MAVSIAVPPTTALRDAALTVLLGALPAEQRQQQLAEMLAAVDRNELSLDNLLIAVDGNQIVGSVLAVVRPGGAVFLWPPVVGAGTAGDDAALALLQAVASRVDSQGAQFTQCLLDPDDANGRAMLDRGGFPFTTELIALSRPLGGPAPGRQPKPNDGLAELTVQYYTDGAHSEFARIVERTYEKTLDCPALARFRGGESSLAAHRATGHFVPEAWRLYGDGGRPLGVLILADHPDRNVWEVAYLGVIPEERGRGIGRVILQDGLKFAKDSGRSAVEIAVDAGNSPAVRLYKSLGFTELRRFAVHLRVRSALPDSPGHEPELRSREW
jgi:ribosomal protein S18 acetylase RimI-like enzyme